MGTRAVVQAWQTAWVGLDFEALRNLCAEDMVEYSPLGKGLRDVTVDYWIGMAARWDQAFEPMSSIVENNRAALHWIETGRAVGPFNGKPGSQRPYKLYFMEFLEIRDNLIKIRWSVRDTHPYFVEAGW